MRPPICVICQKRFSPSSSKSAGLLHFKLSEEDRAFNQRMKERRMVGHPKGREWFCKIHYPIAKRYLNLTLSEAKPKIRSASKLPDWREWIFDLF